jgi:hypothetical protein
MVSARRLIDAALVPGGVSGREIAAITGLVRARYDDLFRDLGRTYGYGVECDTRSVDPLDWIYRVVPQKKKKPGRRTGTGREPMPSL